MNAQHILIIGASSAIAEATARSYAAEGASLLLVGRNARRLEAIAADLQLRGAASATTYVLDADALDAHDAMLEAAWLRLGTVDLALIAHGNLPNTETMLTDSAALAQQFMTNAVSAMALSAKLATRLQRQGRGALAVLSSVAGDRGRASNFPYGAAKAALSCFLSGLRQRLAGSGVQVLTVKPGLIDTPMTREFPKGPLWAQPEQVAADIRRALRRGAPVVYTPARWALIMWIIRALPERLFMRFGPR